MVDSASFVIICSQQVADRDTFLLQNNAVVVAHQQQAAYNAAIVEELEIISRRHSCCCCREDEEDSLVTIRETRCRSITTTTCQFPTALSPVLVGSTASRFSRN
jgi:hypothetical protein